MNYGTMYCNITQIITQVIDIRSAVFRTVRQPIERIGWTIARYRSRAIRTRV